jgi:N-acetylglucosamine-6-sulfatase
LAVGIGTPQRYRGRVLARGVRPQLALILAALGAAVLALPSGAAAQRPSFIHIMTDDQTVDSIRHLPHIKRLLRRGGTEFSNYHVTDPLCCPSRASFLTGQYTHNHGVLHNLPPYGYGAVDWERTLYTAMHDAGYRTGWLGKVLNAVGDEGLTPEPGFDEWLVPLRESQHDMFNYSISDNGNKRRVSGVYQNTFYRQRARRFIDDSEGQPFLLTVSIFSPHWTICSTGKGMCPPVPDHRDRGSFRGERFDFGPSYSGGRGKRQRTNQWWRRELESLQSVDRLVRSLVVKLRRSGRLDDTYVIFQSDNGMLHGQHDYFFEKNLPWDRSVRVPLLIRGPGFEAGGKRGDLTANVDLPATILDAGRAEPPLPADGYSLLSGNRRRILLLERLIHRHHRPAWLQIKNRRGWAYWEERGGGPGGRHLYNMRKDPEQVRNIARQRRPIVKRMRARIARHAACANPCP